jgi:F-type H+-transporting ATPase subunit b
VNVADRPSAARRGRGGAIARWLLLATMAAVTAWPVWALATQQRPEHAPAAAHEGHKAGAEHAAGSEGQGEAHEEAPPPINWTNFGGNTPPFLAMLINFGILAAGYYLLGRKPIAAGLQNRRDTITKEIDEAQRMRKEAEERAKRYQAQLDTLQQEMRTARDALVRAGEAERERLVREADAKAERMKKDAEFLVAQEVKQVRQDLLRDAVEVAVAAAEELLKQRITSADQERLAEEYLADLGAPPRAAGSSPSVRERETSP